MLIVMALLTAELPDTGVMPTDPVMTAALCFIASTAFIPENSNAGVTAKNDLINAWSARYAKLAGVPDDDNLDSTPKMEAAFGIFDTEFDALKDDQLKWCRAHKPK